MIMSLSIESLLSMDGFINVAQEKEVSVIGLLLMTVSLSVMQSCFLVTCK